MNNKGKIAITEIIILIVGVIAVAYFAGIFNIGFVSSASHGIPSGPPSGQIAGRDVWYSGAGQERALIYSDGSVATTAPGAPATTATTALPTTGGSSWLSRTLGMHDPKAINQATGKPYGQGAWTTGSGADAILSGLQWGVLGYLGFRYLIGPMFGLDDEQSEALGIAAGAGLMTFRTLQIYFGPGGAGAGTNFGTWVSGGSGGWFPAGAGIVVAVVIFLLLYKEKFVREVTFDCKPWDSPEGGEKCEECNKMGVLPCSEYQCKSLGQACELLNKGTKEEACAWVNPKDVIPPIINTWNEPLLEEYVYSPDSAINPPDRGVRIVAPTEDECIPAFTPLAFGIQTDEPARCKMDYRRVRNFTEMKYWFGESDLYRYNHTQTMHLPGKENAEQENITLYNDGQFDIFVRCQDANGNKNEANFVFKFCVDKGPDTTAPYVVDTDVLNNMPVAVGQDSLDMSVYINEPAECKWSTMDKTYEQMENEMDCSGADSIMDVIEINARGVYTCITTLEGIKDKEENKFYFRCKDQPKLEGTNRSGDRNVNAQSYLFTVFGTQELVIDEAGPEGTVRDSTESVKVTLSAKTSAGYKEGESICYYQDVNLEDEEFIEFFNTGGYGHSTDLYLAEADEYQYMIRCVDLGGNSDEWQVNFSVESDTEAPIVVRAFKEENYLKIVTDDNATCVYDTTSCSYLFEDGIPMTTETNKANHVTEWTTKNKFYIKCKDDFNNQPPTEKCSAIVRPI